jgi:hypothetical protein
MLSQPINAALELRRSTVSAAVQHPAPEQPHQTTHLLHCRSCPFVRAFGCFCGDARQQRADADADVWNMPSMRPPVGRPSGRPTTEVVLAAVPPRRLRRTPRGRFGCDRRAGGDPRGRPSEGARPLRVLQTRDRFAGRMSNSDPVPRQACSGQVGPSVEPRPPGAAEARRTDSDRGSQQVSVATLVTTG